MKTPGKSKLTLEERRRYINVPVRSTGTDQIVPITVHKTRFEDYKNEGRQANIAAVLIVCFAIAFIGLAKLNWLPSWLVQFTMPRIYG